MPRKLLGVAVGPSMTALRPVLRLAHPERLSFRIQRHIAEALDQHLAGAHPGLALDGEDKPARRSGG